MNPTCTALRSHFGKIKKGIEKSLHQQSMKQHGKICCQKCLDEFSPQDPQDPSRSLNPLKRQELHHIKQLKNHSHFSDDLGQLKRLLNQPSNLAMLCKLCHSEFHDLYEDKESISKDQECFDLFMSSPASGDYLKGYLERQKLKKRRQHECMRKHRQKNAERALARA